MEYLDKLENRAISFIKTVASATDEKLYSGNSGGKDSAIVDYLLQKSGIEYASYHTNTTLDPPGTITHLKSKYPHTEILKPNETFYQLIRRKGLPTRLSRWCCEELKEYGSIAKMVFEGVRSAESKNRKGRDYIECDKRKFQKGAKHIYPIYDWSNNDVWAFIKSRKITLAPHYEDAKKLGLTRLGCVGCPLVATHIRKKEFGLYPKILTNIQKAIQVGMDNNPQWKLSVACNSNSGTAIQWWLSGETMSDFFSKYKFEKKLNDKGKKIGWTKSLKPIKQTSINL